MTLGNTAAQYGAVTKTFHWLTALLVVTVIPLGMIASDRAEDLRAPASDGSGPDIATTAMLFSLHKTIGVTILFVALARILWAIRQPAPGLLSPERHAQAFLARTIHWILYGSLVVVPLTGWIHHAATIGFAPIWWPFGQSLPLVPESASVAAVSAGLHVVLERVLLIALILHIAGALKHHLIDRDMTLRRMWPGQSAAPQPPEQTKTLRPAATAVAVWALAIGIGAATGAYRAADTPARPAVVPQQVRSDWQVSDGSLAISVIQMGSRITGQFADWTAAISFGAPDASGSQGQVDVTIVIGSLTLGAVTGQAMGPDYFNAETFPTATFRGDITRTDTGYLATGPLTIRDVSLPVALSFDLVQDGNTATMTGSLRLNRLDFGIGATQPDQASLAHHVDVSVALTATRTTAGD